MDGLVLIHILD